MTDGEWQAEEYRRQRRSRSWWSCKTVLIGAVAVLVGVARLLRVAVDRIGR